MAVKIVTLNYNPKDPVKFGPDPRTVTLGPGDSIRFALGESTRTAKPGGRLRITLHKNDELESTVLEQAAGGNAKALELSQVKMAAVQKVIAKLRLNGGRIQYRCELIDANGVAIPDLVSDGASGGEIVPDTVGS